MTATADKIDTAHPLAAFADPAEVRRLMESIGAGGAIAVAVDCALANPRTWPAIGSLVAGGYIVVTERTAVMADIFRLTDKGVDLARALGIDVEATAAGSPASAAVLADVADVKSSISALATAPMGSGFLDPAAVDSLSMAIFTPVREHLRQSPPSRWRIGEALNALGVVAGSIIAACGKGRAEAMSFFQVTVDGQAAAMAEDEETSPLPHGTPAGSLRPLIIDDGARALAARVVAHAALHPYRPGTDAPPPGDDPRHVACFGTFRAVFTFTQDPDGRLWRHLTVSVPGENYPNPAAAFTIAQALFGFSGWDETTLDRAPDGWSVGVHKEEHCIVLAQMRADDAGGEAVH